MRIANFDAESCVTFIPTTAATSIAHVIILAHELAVAEHLTTIQGRLFLEIVVLQDACLHHHPTVTRIATE